MNYRIVFAGQYGPEFWCFKSAEEMAAMLMAMFQRGCEERTATAWKMVRSKWEPMFFWQHSD